MKIHIPAFEPMLKANEHLAHGAFDIDLGDDVVQVARCKDCDNRECEGREGLIVCGIDGTSHPKDWFCADGERKSNT